MKSNFLTLVLVALLSIAWSCNGKEVSQIPDQTQNGTIEKTGEKVELSDSEKELLARPTPEPGTKASFAPDYYRSILTNDEYNILREQGTERAFTGVYDKADEPGVYRCRGCNAPLFTSDTKFDSGTGWPSFYTGIEQRVDTAVDNKMGVERTEIICSHCGGHLGHVFKDGPDPTGLRYCVNSASLVFEPAADEKSE